MTVKFGLYYPFNIFRDDAWIKLAALYWDRLGRIVHYGYQSDDSDTVRQLTEELGFIINIEPTADDLKVVSQLFHDMFLRDQDIVSRLVSTYGLALKSEWADDPLTVLLESYSYGFWRLGPLYEVQRPDPGFSYIYAGMQSDLLEKLVRYGLAAHVREPSGVYSNIWVGMHPKLAYVYMEVLAEQMASAQQLEPVADNILAHLAVSGYTLERLIQAQLKADDEKHPLVGSSLAAHEIETQIVTIALQSVLPHDIATLPTKKIVQLRNQRRDELTAFQSYMQEFVSDLTNLQTILDPVALKAHLEVEYEKKLKPQLGNLKKCLKSLGIDTVTGSMNIRVALPALLAGGGASFAQAHLGSAAPFVIGAGAVAFSLLPVIREKRKVALDTIRSSPVAYLLYVQEGLKPATLMSQIAQGTRRFVLGI